jgi:hypothetical protein
MTVLEALCSCRTGWNNDTEPEYRIAEQIVREYANVASKESKIKRLEEELKELKGKK